MERDTYRVVYRLVGAINVRADDKNDAREQVESMSDVVLHRNVDSVYVSDVFKIEGKVTDLQ